MHLSKRKKPQLHHDSGPIYNIRALAILPVSSTYTGNIHISLFTEQFQKNPKKSIFCLICSPAQVNSPEGRRVI